MDIVKTDVKSAGESLAETIKEMKYPAIWSDRKNMTSVQNAYGHWTKHGNEFPEFQNAVQYVEGAFSFMKNPPSGTLTKVRSNGDKLFYHPSTNTFAIQNSYEAPRTMFKPSLGQKYWDDLILKEGI